MEKKYLNEFVRLFGGLSYVDDLIEDNNVEWLRKQGTDIIEKCNDELYKLTTIPRSSSLLYVENPAGVAPSRQAKLTPSAKIRLLPHAKIKMSPVGK